MRIRYLNGNVKILGLWYPTTNSIHSRIHDGSTFSMKKICFHRGTAEYITDIYLSNDEDDESSDSTQIFDVGEVNMVPISIICMLTVAGCCMVVLG